MPSNTRLFSPGREVPRKVPGVLEACVPKGRITDPLNGQGFPRSITLHYYRDFALIAGGTRASDAEFPHMAAIGYAINVAEIRLGKREISGCYLGYAKKRFSRRVIYAGVSYIYGEGTSTWRETLPSLLIHRRFFQRRGVCVI